MRAQDGTRRKTKSQLISLLEAVANERTDLSLENFCSKQIRWAMETGLGPLLFHSIQQRPDNSAFPFWPLLRAADLTARVLMWNQLEALGEIIDACHRRGIPITLLKGSSIGEECYPEPHLRLMRDVDFLVPEHSLPAVEAMLQETGYQQSEDGYTEHHNKPFFHEGKGVWVEVHHRLFSGIQRAATDRVFNNANVLAELRPSKFQGREVFRLSPELQLVYVACHWAQVLKPVGGAIAMLDAIYLLKHAGDALRWARILDWVDGCPAARYLYLLLSYLDCYRLVKIAPEVMQQLLQTLRSFGKLRLKAAHAIIDRYFIEGKDFGRILNPRRLDIAWQLLTLPNPFLRKLILRKVMPGQLDIT